MAFHLTLMHCQQFEDRLNALLDARERPDADAMLCGHAAICERCRHLLAGQQTLLARLAESVIAAPQPDFARRVVALAVNEPVAKARRRWPLLIACLASAAALLLGISFLLSNGNRESADWARLMARRPAVAKPKRPAGRLALINPGGRTPDIHHVDRAAFTGADLLLEAPRLPQHLRSYRGAMDDMVVSLPGAAQRLGEVEEVVPGIRPLRFSLSLIWDTLVQPVPAARDEQPRPNRGAVTPPTYLQVA